MRQRPISALHQTSCSVSSSRLPQKGAPSRRGRPATRAQGMLGPTTWTRPVKLTQGKLWYCHPGSAVYANGRIYFVMEQITAPIERMLERVAAVAAWIERRREPLFHRIEDLVAHELVAEPQRAVQQAVLVHHHGQVHDLARTGRRDPFRELDSGVLSESRRDHRPTRRRQRHTARRLAATC